MYNLKIYSILQACFHFKSSKKYSISLVCASCMYAPRVKDKDVKLLVAICFYEIIRILAPNPDFSDELLKDILKLFIILVYVFGMMVSFLVHDHCFTGLDCLVLPRRPGSKPPEFADCLMDTLIRHRDKDVKLFVVICFRETIRILAPNPDFNDELLRFDFQKFTVFYDVVSLLFLPMRMYITVPHHIFLKSYSMMEPFLHFYDYERHKHDTQAAFINDFLDITRCRGKMYINCLEDFTVLFGYNKSGIYNCQDFKMIRTFTSDLQLKWCTNGTGGNEPEIIQLPWIEILLNLRLHEIDYKVSNPKINPKMKFFQLNIPTITQHWENEKAAK
ncbi:hypothetical protein POM88_037710 [Heracleum sosnowskyi]|uniref:Uncharacterized protein n=1 Tax=Heracleum sosnowskyi TaxID=360622 RepID=A0AAD8HRM3_9APIA|nr:hypothetical protein POM88_037710 [Heracleum sosnowskyi]